MTKKNPIKNKEWEKERRNRLNKTFDRLANTLPKNETGSYSKIEILQKAIVVIEELKKKVKELLTASNATILKSQEELEEGFKVLVIRNHVLQNLLTNAKITVPPFTAPKIFDYVVTHLQDNENNFNELNIKPIGRPPKYSNKINPEKAKEICAAEEKQTKPSKKRKTEQKPPETSNQIDHNTKVSTKETPEERVFTKQASPQLESTNVTNVKSLQTISTSSQSTKANEPVKTTTVTSAMIISSSTISSPINNNTILSQSPLATPIMTTGIVIQTGNLIKMPILMPAVKSINTLLNIQPMHISSAHHVPPKGKIAIPALKRSINAIKQKHKRKRKTKLEYDTEKKAAAVKAITSTQSEFNSMNTGNKTNKKRIIEMSVSLNAKEMKMSSTRDTIEHDYSSDKNTSLQSELSKNTFTTLPVPIQESCELTTLSPTAAFLLSFPVVSAPNSVEQQETSPATFNIHELQDDIKLVEENLLNNNQKVSTKIESKKTPEAKTNELYNSTKHTKKSKQETKHQLDTKDEKTNSQNGINDQKLDKKQLAVSLLTGETERCPKNKDIIQLQQVQRKEYEQKECKTIEHPAVSCLVDQVRSVTQADSRFFNSDNNQINCEKPTKPVIEAKQTEKSSIPIFRQNNNNQLQNDSKKYHQLESKQSYNPQQIPPQSQNQAEKQSQVRLDKCIAHQAPDQQSQHLPENQFQHLYERHEFSKQQNTDYNLQSDYNQQNVHILQQGEKQQYMQLGKPQDQDQQILYVQESKDKAQQQLQHMQNQTSKQQNTYEKSKQQLQTKHCPAQQICDDKAPPCLQQSYAACVKKHESQFLIYSHTSSEESIQQAHIHSQQQQQQQQLLLENQSQQQEPVPRQTRKQNLQHIKQPLQQSTSQHHNQSQKHHQHFHQQQLYQYQQSHQVPLATEHNLYHTEKDNIRQGNIQKLQQYNSQQISTQYPQIQNTKSDPRKDIQTNLTKQEVERQSAQQKVQQSNQNKKTLHHKRDPENFNNVNEQCITKKQNENRETAQNNMSHKVDVLATNTTLQPHSVHKQSKFQVSKDLKQCISLPNKDPHTKSSDQPQLQCQKPAFKNELQKQRSSHYKESLQKDKQSELNNQCKSGLTLANSLEPSEQLQVINQCDQAPQQQQQQQSHHTSYNHSNNDNLILDNFSAMFTTRDYDRFMEDVAKNENELYRLDTSLEPSFISSKQPDDSFDFYLKSLRKCDSTDTPDTNTISYNRVHPLLSSPPKIRVNTSLFSGSEIIPPISNSNSSVLNHSYDYLTKKSVTVEGSAYQVVQPTPTFTFSLTSTTTSTLSQHTLQPSHTTQTASAINSCQVSSAAASSYGFYDALSTIGTSSNQTYSAAHSKLASTPTMYTSALALSCSSSSTPINNKAKQQIETANYAPQTSFTFSLTTSTSMAPHIYAKCATVTTATNSITQDSIFSMSITEPSLSTPISSSFANAYNPFSFDNVSANNENNQFSFCLTRTSTSLPKTSLPISSSTSTLNPFSIDYNILPEPKEKTIDRKSVIEQNKKLGVPKIDGTTNVTAYPEQGSKVVSPIKGLKNVQKPHVNWMTSNNDDFNPIIPPPLDFTHQSFCAPSILPPGPLPQIPSKSDGYFPHVTSTEEQFPWSPNKFFDPSTHLNSIPLPNLHGDLALNNFSNNKTHSTLKQEKVHKNVNDLQSNNQSSNNFFSVSQLVDQSAQHVKYDSKNLNSKAFVQKHENKTNKVASGTAIKLKEQSLVKRSTASISLTTNTISSSNKSNNSEHIMGHYTSSNIFADSCSYQQKTYQSNDPAHDTNTINCESKQNISNIYSAEALISNPMKKEKLIINYNSSSEYNCNNNGSSQHQIELHHHESTQQNYHQHYQSQQNVSDTAISTPNMFSNIDYSTESNFNYYGTNYLPNCYENDYLGAATSNVFNSNVTAPGRPLLVPSTPVPPPPQPLHIYPFTSPSKGSSSKQTTNQPPMNSTRSSNKKSCKQELFQAHRDVPKAVTNFNMSTHPIIHPLTSYQQDIYHHFAPPPPSHSVKNNPTKLPSQSRSMQQQIQQHQPSQSSILHNNIQLENGHQQHQQMQQQTINQHQHMQHTTPTHNQTLLNSVATAAVAANNISNSNQGNLVTNFNLSTICPEINNDKLRHSAW